MVEKLSTPSSNAAEIRAFRVSVAQDLYSPESFLPWEQVDHELAGLTPGITLLQQLVDNGDRRAEALAEALVNEPGLLRVFQRLLAAPGGAGFADGRRIPEAGPLTGREARRLARLLTNLGIWRLVPPTSRVEDLARVALVAADSRRRGFRRTGTIQRRLRRLVDSALADVSRLTTLPLSLMRSSDFPPAAQGRAGFLVSAAGRPVAAVNAVFQATSGGRQQRDLLVTYPSFQVDLDSVPAHLILIADGRGFVETPGRILEGLFSSVAACMTVRQAESGHLAEAIEAAVASSGLRGRARAPLDRLIASALEGDGEATANGLPSPVDSSRLALARYADEHRELALILAPAGDAIRWERADLVSRSTQLAISFDRRVATSLLRALLGGTAAVLLQEDDPSAMASLLEVPGDSVIPDAIVTYATEELVRAEIMRSVSVYSLAATPESKMAVLLAPGRDPAFSEVDQRRLQAVLPVNVIMVEPANLERMAQARRPPREAFAELVLHQSDLTKASPFILSSATPARMFFGRDAEEASLIATVATNSVAVLGSRKIGKTSLLRHVESQLSQAGFAPYFMDCQTIRSWEDFGSLAARRWDVELSSTFKPRHVLSLAAQLASRQEGSLVILLDEIDQLLDWDQQHTEEEVPEAFFRACRTLSQEHSAQFVFSGERTIARKLWDPHSPHWNFCRPLLLQQLTRDASDLLLVHPLESLQVSLRERQEILDELWLVTSGHPQLIQLIGDSLVRILDGRDPRERGAVTSADFGAVVGTYEFREAYLETYWGQATPFERLVSIWVAAGTTKPAGIVARVRDAGMRVAAADVASALRMLTLYGILISSGDGYALRAAWFPHALDAYGGPDAIEAQLLPAAR